MLKKIRQFLFGRGGRGRPIEPPQRQQQKRRAVEIRVEPRTSDPVGCNPEPLKETLHRYLDYGLALFMVLAMLWMLT